MVEHHELVALGLKWALSERYWDVETNSGPTDSDAIAHAQRFGPQCVLLDIHLGSEMGSGIDLIRPMVSTGSHVVMLTAERRRLALAECVEAGADGWISKNAGLDDVDSALGHILDGGSLVGRADRAALLDELRRERALTLRSHATFEQLTQREALVLGALVDGLSAEEIADAHFVALTTVRSQIRAVLQKLGVRSQIAAVALAGLHRELLPYEAQAARNRRRARPAALSGPEYRR